MKCIKCNGRLVREEHYLFVRKFTGVRCMNCGLYLDPAILTNRLASLPAEYLEEPSDIDWIQNLNGNFVTMSILPRKLTRRTQTMSNLDSILRDLLVKNPDLLKRMQNVVGGPTASDRTGIGQTAKKKHPRPGPDYRLLILSGCETCHFVTEIGYAMQWDEENRLFRQSLLRKTNKAFIETKIQITTTTTCLCCVNVLGDLEVREVIDLLLLLQNPTESMARTIAFKEFLRKKINNGNK